VSRESGLQPDPIPPVSPNNQVLVTADALAPQPDGAAPVHGSADWLAAGVNGDDDQDNDGDRRAKTRKQDQ
jgi:Meckel syndrome type 1 protein